MDITDKWNLEQSGQINENMTVKKYCIVILIFVIFVVVFDTV